MVVEQVLEMREETVIDERDWPIYAVKTENGELFYHEVFNGNRYNTGDGWLMVTPWGEERKRGGFNHGDSRIRIEPENVESIELLSPTPRSGREE